MPTSFVFVEDRPRGLESEAGERGVLDHLIAGAGGSPLPGKWGLAQALIGCWSQPCATNRYLHYTKVGLNTVGIVRTYRRGNDPTKFVKKKDPLDEFIEENDLEIPRELDSLSNFIYVYSRGVGFEDFYPGKNTDGETSGKSFLRAFTLKSGIKYYFAYKPFSRHSRSEDYEKWLEGPYVKSDKVKDFLREINEVIWDAENNNDLQLSAKPDRWGYNSSFVLSNIGTPDDYVSQDAETEWADVEALSERCASFLDNGLTRKILFYGPPGTGKTTLARTLARKVSKGKTLRIESNAIESAGTRAVMDFIMLLRPKVVLFDDLDRSKGMVVEILHYMEGIGNTDSIYRELWDDGLLIVGTVNTLKTIDPALLRPGRFDEVVQVPEPGDKHRVNIVRHYMDKFGVKQKDLKAVAPRGKKKKALAWLSSEMRGFSPADIREVTQCVATVGLDYLNNELTRVRMQRELYAGEACDDFLSNDE
jgi:hypothetical protein